MHCLDDGTPKRFATRRHRGDIESGVKSCCLLTVPEERDALFQPQLGDEPTELTGVPFISVVRSANEESTYRELLNTRFGEGTNQVLPAFALHQPADNADRNLVIG
jgi:hypothetical protein